jgi:hypothetical protein
MLDEDDKQHPFLESSLLHSTEIEKLIKITKSADEIMDRIGFTKQTKIDYLKEFFNDAEV